MAVDPAPRQRTTVIQSFRDHDVPEWIQRCLDSVKRWTELHGHEYALHGDEFYDLCGPEYLARVGGNVRSITNLARLEATRIKLAEGYDRVIWLDADVFVFDPGNLLMETDAGYAFSREVWVEANGDGSIKPIHTSLHNAAFVFTPRQTDLDLFISVIRHIVMTRMISSNYQVGVRLLTGLSYPLDIKTMNSVGMFSPHVMEAIAVGNTDFIRQFARLQGAPTQAANLCLSLNGQFTESMMMTAMDRLETSAGAILNDHLAGG
jgi:hypothetical protein